MHNVLMKPTTQQKVVKSCWAMRRKWKREDENLQWTAALSFINKYSEFVMGKLL